MKVSIVTAWAHREAFSKFFIRHYAWADKVIALIGPGLWQGPDFGENVEIRKVEYPLDRFCEYSKRDHLNAAIREIRADWVLCVDADEFVFTMDRGRPEPDIRPLLEKVTDGNVIVCNLWDVYRHITDRDLDPDQAPLLQRRHGDPHVSFLYEKPIVFRPESGIQFHSGQHRYFANPAIKLSRRRLPGAHWKYADLTTALERQGIRDRLLAPLQKQPPVNIRARIARHMKDPRLF
jgi:hypothetical protein